MAKGFDCASTVANADCFAGKGYTVAIRYYSARFPAKVITPAEAQHICQAGLSLMVVYQDSNNKPHFFSHDIGLEQGQQAVEYAINKIKQPTDSAIYFAVDFDATKQEIDDNVIAYFQGVNSSVGQAAASGHSYHVGVYGSGLVCSSVIGKNLARYAWLAGATGWRDSRDFSGWQVRQIISSSHPTIECGIEIDTNDIKDGGEGFGSFVVDTTSDAGGGS